ncbi:unnamed protein product [Miscanthus lutarioriparius]|uniref:Retroviral polymerase SH3-like domain-containing protein n=1 Tax=Miscanthus lutarioriparius TaxID=422564 RepID=A0A811Q486_9POAL|nr:unnamed protein product [Miscanthus lutarioriparius]
MKFDLPLLNYDTRFSLWQVKMRGILAQTHDYDEALDSFGKRKAEWTPEEIRKDQKALALIQLHLHNDILQECLKEKTAAELWLKLESICMSKDLTSKMQMKMKLFTLKMKEEDSVMSHIAEFKKIVADLVSMEVKYDDEDLGLLLLCSLPNSYANFRDTILLSRDELTLKEVYEALQSREKMRGMVQNDGTSSSKGDALHVRGRTENRSSNDGNDGRKNYERRGRSKSKPHGNKKFCVYCKLTNHNIEDCRKVHVIRRRGKQVGRSGVKGYKLWNPETVKTFMSRSVVFNESVMFTDSLPSDHVPEKELQRMRMQVEHVDDDTGVQVEHVDDDTGVQVEPIDEHGDHDNDVAEDDAHDDVQQTPPILQLEEDLPIAQRKSKRTIAPPKRLIEECNLSYYALSCAEQVENVHEPATYKEAIRCGDTENWISAMHEEMQSLEKNSTWEISKIEITKLKKLLSSEFDMKDLGSAKKILDLSYAMSLVSRYMSNPAKNIGG